MKRNYLFVFLIAAAILISSCGKKSNKELLTGSWSLVGVEDHGKPENIDPDRKVEAVFTKDNGIYSIRITPVKKDTGSRGTYTLSEDGKTLSVYEMGDDTKSNADVSTITELNETALKLADSHGMVMTFKKK